MEMIKLTLAIVALIAVFFWMGDTSITLKPFSFKVANWSGAIGYLLFVSGYVLLMSSSYREGRKDATNELIQILENYKPAEQTNPEPVEVQ
jgi:hypothetical protein